MEGMKFDQGKSASYLVAHDVVIHDEHTSWSPAFYMARLREWWNRASTLPALALVNEDFEGVVKVLEFGAKKYAARNWEAGIAYHRVFRAADKHYRNIGTLDAETGLPHLHHFLCCYMFLAAYTARGLHQFDDRPGVGPYILKGQDGSPARVVELRVHRSETERSQDLPREYSSKAAAEAAGNVPYRAVRLGVS
jgi:Domain of unknown function (DUF5664)